MRILHISKYYYPYIGGVENICRYLVEGTNHHETAVLCFNDGSEDCVDEIDGIKVYRVGTWINISRQALSLSYFPMMRRALKEFLPDIVHFHWANPYPAAVLLTMFPKDVKLVIHWHMDIIKQSLIYPLIKPIETALLKRAEKIIVTSPQYLNCSIPLAPYKNKVLIVPNAIDERNFVLRDGDSEQINQLKTKYGGKKIVFFVGRHIQYKGLPLLIEAEKYLKEECVLLVAGNGPMTDTLKKNCHSKRVKFIGRLSDDELRWHHHAASVFAFPSITKNEAFGVALAEAMFCYTPAVTFTIHGSGVNWVNLDGVTGIEVPNGDVQAFARAIDELLSDNVLADKYAKAANNRVVNMFLKEHMVTAVEDCYQELL